jgi:two-component system chemotaxis sensor kinase CheA
VDPKEAYTERDTGALDPELVEIYTGEAEEHLRSITAGLARLEKKPDSRQTLQEIRRAVHTLKSAAAVVGFSTIAGLAHRLEDLLDSLYESAQPVPQEAMKVLLTGTDILGRLAKDSPEKLDSAIDELHSSLNQLAPKKDSIEIAIGELLSAAMGMDGLSSPRGRGASDNTKVIRIRQSRLDALADLMSDLVACTRDLTDRVGKLQVSGRARLPDEIQSVLQRQQKITNEIEDGLRDMRLLPVGVLAMRLQRMVRATADQQRKRAELALEGAGVELETTMIDQIVGPLLHVLRNAVAHGIEPPAVRKQLGKPECGTITLRASYEYDLVVLRVTDDGRGLDTEAIRKRAIELGHVTAAAAGEIADQELHRLIFKPGFSTAESLSEVAGRGIGMDAVEDIVSRLNGEIGVESLPGKGTAFTIQLPKNVPASMVTIMTIDDSPSIRRANAKVIESAGWTPLDATNGLDALEQLRYLKDTPKAFLLDIEMPHMDGFGFLAAVKEHPAYWNIPVIVITSRDGEEHRKKAMELGAADYLVKPYDEQVLIQRLRRLVS